MGQLPLTTIHVPANPDPASAKEPPEFGATPNYCRDQGNNNRPEVGQIHPRELESMTNMTT
ncbi:hypothetical protein SAMN05421752_1364 [Natronorubrum thiooxidans]|uniref:Uncharacterized protein n=1 Tax=Natronorubrum thiooxidans TaxID=308853 RepID=A0A1N7H989_9EURY|nr:hypothetical protein SAMN05421752_1364 [Natronorubrum thiooxidans]